MGQSIYEKYGGFKAISKVVMTFYDLALDSDQIGPYFDDIDMPRLIDHQTKFVSSMLGGPASFSDDRLEVVHRNLGITHQDFDELMVLMRNAFATHGIDEGDIKIALQAIEDKRSIIVQKGAA